VALHSAAAAEALTLARKAGLDLDLALEVLNSSAAASAMLKVRGPMVVRNEFPAQMKLDLFMKDLHLMQDAAAAVGAPLPFTDLAERLYAAAQAAGHGGEDLAVVVTALETQGAGRRKASRSATSTRRRAKSTPKSGGRRRPRHK
jgi:putative dehydrogenase